MIMQYTAPNFPKAKAPTVNTEKILSDCGFEVGQNENMLCENAEYLNAAKYLTENFSYITDFYRYLLKAEKLKNPIAYRFSPRSTSRALATELLRRLMAAGQIRTYYESCQGDELIAEFCENSSFSYMLQNGLSKRLLKKYEADEIYIPKLAVKSREIVLSPAVILRCENNLKLFFLRTNAGADSDCPSHDEIIARHCKNFTSAEKLFQSYIITTEAGARIYKNSLLKYGDRILSVGEISAM